MVRSILLTVAILIVGSVGCSSTSVPASDIAEAKKLVSTVLDSWKEGKTIAELKSRSPTIVVGEVLWEKQTGLQSYEIQGDGKMQGTNVRFTVLLNYTTNGKKASRAFNYLVTTAPVLTFFREDG
jgi:hypothetical protein